MLIVFFSRNRPIQLYAALESFDKYATRLPFLTMVAVNYRADTEQYESQYKEIDARFQSVEFFKEKNFRTDIMLQMNRESQYISFMVDDNIFLAPFDLGVIESSLESNPKAIAFSLRMGTTINYNYNKRVSHAFPAFLETEKEGIIKYDWTHAPVSYNYPLELSCSVYRKNQIYGLMQFCDMPEPNTFEAELAALRGVAAKRYPQVLCYDKPRSFCIPCNKVQNIYDNPSGEEFGYTPEQLAGQFDQGKKIDISKFDGFVPTCCHHEKELEFIDR